MLYAGPFAWRFALLMLLLVVATIGMVVYNNRQERS